MLMKQAVKLRPVFVFKNIITGNNYGDGRNLPSARNKKLVNTAVYNGYRADKLRGRVCLLAW